MSDQLVPAQNIELSDDELEGVAGGTFAPPSVAFGTADAQALAFGPGATAVTSTHTQNFAAPGTAFSSSSSTGLAIS
jgi:hypothetical protein